MSESIESDATSGGRGRVLSRGIATSVLSRGAAALVPVVSVPIMLEALGVPAYGAWSAAIALTALAVFADLGLGVGLMTRLSAALADRDRQKTVAYVSTAYALLGAIAALFTIIVIGLNTRVNWAVIVGANPSDVLASQTTVIVIIAFILNIPASLIVRIQYASGEMGRSNVWQAMISIMSLVTIVILSRIGSSAIFFVLVVAFVPIIGNILNSAVFFSIGRGKTFRPTVASINLNTARTLLNLGSRFLIISILMSVSFGADTWIVALASSVEDAATFAIPARVFSLLGVLVAVLSIPIWPVAVQALKADDAAWLSRTTRRMILISVIAVGIAGFVGVWWGPIAIDLWLDGQIVVSRTILVGFALVALVQAALAPLFMVANAAEVLRYQMIGYALLTILFPTKWWVSESIGFEYLPYVSLGGLLLVALPFAVVGYQKSITKTV